METLIEKSKLLFRQVQADTIENINSRLLDYSYNGRKEDMQSIINVHSLNLHKDIQFIKDKLETIASNSQVNSKTCDEIRKVITLLL